ncbi:arginyltransferase [Thermodesulfobacteriota bacterium]
MQFNLIQPDLEKYFFNIPLDCPYNLPHQAIYRQALLNSVPDPIMERFMATGYRRSGNCLYTMVCPTCQSCVPIRLDPHNIRLNRNQKRTKKHNQDLSWEIAPLEASSQSLALCNTFLKDRFPDKDNSAEEYYFGFFTNIVTDTYEIRYRLADRLIGVAIVDSGCRWLNAVYFFFDPALSRRSLGTFNILTLIEHCRQQNIDHLYLGYRINEIASMSYKGNFKPHQLFINGQWQTMVSETVA